ncbi:hypothetical protein JCGZ_08890 [Jatropha curcas]|uniref:Nucleoside phosphorylase domain-containing protein n=1 Tax=Jatropha curcas TaxID=180498 RepID=A0A067KKH6_JATCU|nr:hypothetical protein JCGZ_08890 [Jatropha curcas]
MFLVCLIYGFDEGCLNEAYGEFIYDIFNVSTLDTSDFAIAMTCFSNNIPYIVFRGISSELKHNLPFARLFGPSGNKNAVKVTAAFLGLLNENNVANP